MPGSSYYGAGLTGKFARGQNATAVQGFTQLQRALRRIEDGTAKELRRRIHEIGNRLALVAAGNAPRGATGDLERSERVSVTVNGASVYSNVVYGGAINVGAWTKHGRGPHIRRANASHYMDRAVTQTQPYVEQEIEAVLDWLTATFEEN